MTVGMQVVLMWAAFSFAGFLGYLIGKGQSGPGDQKAVSSDPDPEVRRGSIRHDPPPRIELREGTEKKGGINCGPATPRPTTPPPGQGKRADQ